LDTTWRNRADFFTGRETAEKFLTRKWEKEHFYMYDLFDPYHVGIEKTC
jgi:nuclear transport factor 2 (NTF2) superfamily protein